MKYIIIDDNIKYAEKLLVELKEKGEVISSESYVLNELANEIQVRAKNESDIVLLININLKAKNSNRQEQKGIELLKWIRIKECYCHCILYSFQFHTSIIKENPLNSILFSKGVTFVQLPITPIVILKQKITEKAERENLVPFFRAQIDLVRIRHEMANVWGLQRLKEILSLDYKVMNENISYEILKFLTPLSNTNKIDKTKLIEAIEKFNPQQRKIFYFDDMADKWGPVLERLFGKENFTWKQPQNIPKDELFKFIENLKPECILLDLRLKNEKDVKDVLEYSGGKLLIELKLAFSSLPIIMFTATNKAESVRKLLGAGAEYVWTKEGVDDGIDDEKTLNSLIELLKEVNNAISKFKNENYRKIFETELKCNKIIEIDSSISDNIIKGGLKNVRNIFIDTNYLIDSIAHDYFDLFYKFLISNPIKVVNGKEHRKISIIIHDDVIKEVYNISKQSETYKHPNPAFDRNNAYRVPVSRFLFKKILEWKEQNLIYVQREGGQDEMIEHVASYTHPTMKKINISDIATSSTERKSFLERIFSSLEDEKEKYDREKNRIIDQVNMLIENFNKNNQETLNLSNLKLHADNTFTKVIPEALKYGSVILVANDKNCAFDVGKYFETNTSEGFVIEGQRDYRKGDQIKNNEPLKMAPCVVQYQILRNDLQFKNVYYHKYAKEFNSSLYGLPIINEEYVGIVQSFLPSRDESNQAKAAFIDSFNYKTTLLHITKCQLINSQNSRNMKDFLALGTKILVKVVQIDISEKKFNVEALQIVN